MRSFGAPASTQETIGETLHVGQPSVAKIEKWTDMYVSNLRRFVEAIGGEVDIIARFPDGEVKIGNFADIKEHPEAREREKEDA